MRWLVACEFSGRVRDALRRYGHDAYSCDLLPDEGAWPEYHYQGDVHNYLHLGWDGMIAHPPCTRLCSSGARHFHKYQQEQEDAVDFVIDLLRAPIKRIALENPIGILSSRIGKPTQIIQPWMFGVPETKATCLWLKNLPELESTEIVAGMNPRVHLESPGPDRWKRRSITLIEIADAMAAQWGNYSVS
jgi:hypothetical protein